MALAAVTRLSPWISLPASTPQSMWWSLSLRTLAVFWRWGGLSGLKRLYAAERNYGLPPGSV